MLRQCSGNAQAGFCAQAECSGNAQAGFCAQAECSGRFLCSGRMLRQDFVLRQNAQAECSGRFLCSGRMLRQDFVLRQNVQAGFCAQAECSGRILCSGRMLRQCSGNAQAILSHNSFAETNKKEKLDKLKNSLASMRFPVVLSDLLAFLTLLAYVPISASSFFNKLPLVFIHLFFCCSVAKFISCFVLTIFAI